MTSTSERHERPRAISAQPPGNGRGETPSRRDVSRSCIPCHRRKVRCDKNLPCAACARGGRDCIYEDVSDRPARRRPRKTTIADVASRVSDLERSIVTSASPAGREAPPQRPSIAGRPTAADPESTGEYATSKVAGEVLVQNGTTSQYIDEIAISRMIEADRDRNSLISTPPDAFPNQTQVWSFSLMGILSHPSSFPDDRGWCINKMNGMKLWQTFVHNIDPLVKVLHIPTAEVDVFTAINEPRAVSKDIIALLHAVYFAAVTSMDAEDVYKMLGMSSMSALEKVRNQFHKALAEADALENPTVTLLQALAIYLHIVPSWNSGRGSWILNGLVLRVGLSIGLHTDGSKLGLSPFNAELRRRVWWHIYTRDFRALEDHGINPQLHLPTSTTRMPLNVEDSDLQPDMAELPSPRLGWTRMTHPIINMEVSMAFHQSLSSANTLYGVEQRMALRNEAFNRIRSRLQGYFDSCQPAVPLQKFTLQIGQAIVHKMDLVTRQQVANLETPDDRDSFATEENLDAACKCLEMNIEVWHDELLRPLRWSQRVHPQYFLVLYVLWHLCIRPDGPQVERAWRVVDGMFQVEQQRLTHAFSAPSLKLVVLQRLRQKAERARASTGFGDNHRTGGHRSDPAGVANSGEDNVEANDLQQEILGGDLSDDWVAALEGMSLPNWNTLVSDLRSDPYNNPGMF